MEKQINFRVNKEQIVGMLHLPENKGKVPAIIMCHGFTGDKVGPYPYLFVYMARYLASRGFAVLRFDFRGSGESEGKFEKQNIPSMLLDLDKAIEFISTQKEINSEKIGLVGHSRGGSVAIIKTSEDPRIKALVTWAAPANWDDIWQKAAENILKIGLIQISNLKETKKLVETDFKFNPITRWAEKVKAPWLIIHGSKDGVSQGSVPVDHAKKLCDASGKKAQLKIIEGAGHSFFEKESRKELFSSTVNFLKNNL